MPNENYLIPNDLIANKPEKSWTEVKKILRKIQPSKAFITEHRHIELVEPYIFINVNISREVYQFVQKLKEIKFEDGQYHKYCGEIKILINNFMNYWSYIVNESVKEADTLLNTMDKKGVLNLIQISIDMQTLKQRVYLEEFGQPENDEEKELLDYMNEETNKRLKDLLEMSSNVKKIDTKERVFEFLNHQLNLSVLKKNTVFELIHTWLAQCLCKYSHRIKASFEEILLRVSNNLKELNEQRAQQLNIYMDELYEANKYRMLVSRQDHHRVSDTAQVEYIINEINSKIERHHLEEPLAQIKEEVAYWRKRTHEFQQLEKTIRKIETELKNVTEYLDRYNTMSTTEYPGSKKTCWENMGENYRRRKDYLKKVLKDASKAVLSFFAAQGQNFIYYKDNIGLYLIDQYGHQNYVFDHGQKVYHITCDNQLVKISDTDKYYYDAVGRYFLDDKATKVYQRAACCSSYNLNENNLLVKTTKDCGHSEVPNPKCGLTIKDPNVIEILPAHKPTDIKQTLSPEQSEYIWHNFAYILADALCDTFNKQSLNQIYCLANRLLAHKYHKNSVSQLKNKLQETDKYKADIYQKRKEKAIAEAKAYKSKQIKPRKPEEFDDAEQRQALAAIDQLTRERLMNDDY